jgi:hypothetical protein
MYYKDTIEYGSRDYTKKIDVDAYLYDFVHRVEGMYDVKLNPNYKEGSGVWSDDVVLTQVSPPKFRSVFFKGHDNIQDRDGYLEYDALTSELLNGTLGSRRPVVMNFIRK